MIRFSGFADEAADGIDGQIAAMRALGWPGIELRSVDGVNIHDLDEAGFVRVARAVEKSGLAVNCIGSTIANWGKSVDEDFSAAMEQVDRAARRAAILGAPMVRIMSYAILFDSRGEPLADQKFLKRVERLRVICERLAEAGLVPVHENCLNYGGMEWGKTLELLQAVPGMKLAFDTGNPTLTPDFSSADRPLPNQDSWESWTRLKSHVVHIHVKDGVRNPATGAETYVYPGEGPSRVADILADAIRGGYSGWLTIEPHMAVVFHDASVVSPGERRMAVFLEYGKRLEALLASRGIIVERGRIGA